MSPLCTAKTELNELKFGTVTMWRVTLTICSVQGSVLGLVWTFWVSPYCSCNWQDNVDLYKKKRSHFCPNMPKVSIGGLELGKGVTKIFHKYSKISNYAQMHHFAVKHPMRPIITVQGSFLGMKWQLCHMHMSMTMETFCNTNEHIVSSHETYH